MSLESERERWLEDLEQRQRNIVFPDTVNNEARFWRGLRDSKRYTVVQWLGITVMGLALLGTIGSAFRDSGSGFSWPHSIWMFSMLLAGALFFGVFFLAMSWSIRRDARLHDKASREPERGKLR